LENIGWNEINEVYEKCFGESLDKPEVEFSIGSAELTISSIGVDFAIFGLRIGGYVDLDGKVSFIKDEGVTLSASLKGDVHIEDFTISDGFLKLTIPAPQSEEKASVIVGGKFEWKNFSFDIGAHIYKSEKDNSVQYTILGKCAHNKGDPCTLVSLVPKLAGCAILKNVTFASLEVSYASVRDKELAALTLLGNYIPKGECGIHQIPVVFAFDIGRRISSHCRSRGDFRAQQPAQNERTSFCSIHRIRGLMEKREWALYQHYISQTIKASRRLRHRNRPHKPRSLSTTRRNTISQPERRCEDPNQGPETASFYARLRPRGRRLS
jgi:hypothetical protein